MNFDPSNPPTVKEFRFNSDSQIVTVVFGDDQAVDFQGQENYDKAHATARHATHRNSEPPAKLSLLDDNGNTVNLVVPQGTPHETFED